MPLRVLLILFFLSTACDSNPLGDSFFSSCQHSPGGNFGVPIACPVNLNASENLIAWFDFNNLNTISFNPPSKVESLPDSSGKLLRLIYKNGTKANYKTNFLNERGVLSFNNTEGSYHLANPQVINTANTSLSLLTVFSINDQNNGAELKINLNSGLQLQVSQSSLQVILNGTTRIETQKYNKLGKNRVYIVKDQIKNKIFLYINSTLTDSISFSDNTIALSQLEISATSIELGEVLIYNEVQTLEIFNTIDDYLKNKWGTP